MNSFFMDARPDACTSGRLIMLHDPVQSMGINATFVKLTVFSLRLKRRLDTVVKVIYCKMLSLFFSYMNILGTACNTILFNPTPPTSMASKSELR